MARAAKTASWRGPRGAFTLVEMMVAMTLLGVVVGGLLSTFLFLSKGGAAMGNYIQMEARSRTLMETLARDVREAELAVFLSDDRLELTVDGATIVYEHDPQDGEVTVARSDGTGAPRVLASGLSSLAFRAFDSSGDATALSASPSNDVKMIQLSIQLRADSNGQSATADVTSPRFALRNKAVPAP